MVQHPGAIHYGDPGLDETMTMIREQFFRFAQEKVAPHRASMASEGRAHSARRDLRDERAWRFRPHDSGGVRRRWSFQDCDVRRLGGTEPRLYRRGFARHAFGDRGGTDPQRRHQGSARALAAVDRQRREIADGRFHRAQYGLRSRFAAHARGTTTASIYKIYRQQDLDHACGARRSDDAARAHRSVDEGLSRAFHVSRGKAARHRGQSVSGKGHVGRRDRRARLSRHEGIRDRLRRVRSAGRRICSAAKKARASSN